MKTGMTLTRVILNNLQSYDEGVSLQLAPSRILCIRGRSEKGKSVCTKFLRYFAANEGQDTWKRLIRQGKSSGELIFVYSDESFVMFHIDFNQRKIIHSFKDGTKKIYNDYEITEEVLAKYGILYDSKSNVLLNIFSREVPLLLISTPKSLNGKIIDTLIFSREVNNLLLAITERRKSLEKDVERYSYRVSQIQAMCSIFKPQNLEGLQFASKSLQSLEIRVADLDSAKERLSEIERLLYDYKEVSDYIPESQLLEEFSRKQYLIENLANELEQLESNLSEYVTTTNYTVNEEQLSVLQLLFSELSVLQSNMTEYTPIKQQSLDVEKLNEYSQLQKLCSDVEKLLLEYNFKDNSKEIKELRKDVRECPVCGQPIPEDYDFCNN